MTQWINGDVRFSYRGFTIPIEQGKLTRPKGVHQLMDVLMHLGFLEAEFDTDQHGTVTIDLKQRVDDHHQFVWPEPINLYAKDPEGRIMKLNTAQLYRSPESEKERRWTNATATDVLHDLF